MFRMILWKKIPLWAFKSKNTTADGIVRVFKRLTCTKIHENQSILSQVWYLFNNTHFSQSLGIVFKTIWRCSLHILRVLPNPKGHNSGFCRIIILSINGNSLSLFSRLAFAVLTIFVSHQFLISCYFSPSVLTILLIQGVGCKYPYSVIYHSQSALSQGLSGIHSDSMIPIFYWKTDVKIYGYLKNS